MEDVISDEEVAEQEMQYDTNLETPQKRNSTEKLLVTNEKNFYFNLKHSSIPEDALPLPIEEILSIDDQQDDGFLLQKNQQHVETIQETQNSGKIGYKINDRKNNSLTIDITSPNLSYSQAVPFEYYPTFYPTVPYNQDMSVQSQYQDSFYGTQQQSIGFTYSQEYQEIEDDDYTDGQATLKKPKKQFQNKDELSNYISGFKKKYKTEICRNWELTGYCEFRESCSFAHGYDEIQKKQHVPQNYKTRLCKQFHENLYCPYGLRCQFLHSERNLKTDKPDIEYSKKLEQNMYKIQQKLALQPSSLTPNEKSKKKNLDLMSVFGKGKRLPVFSCIPLAKENKKKKTKKPKNSQRKYTQDYNYETLESPNNFIFSTSTKSQSKKSSVKTIISPMTLQYQQSPQQSFNFAEQ